MAIGESFAGIKYTLQKKEPEILAVLGLVGMSATVGLAIYSTVKAVKEVEMLEVKKREEVKAPAEEVKVSKQEIAKTVGKYYVPVFVLGCASAFCFLRSNKLYASKFVTVAAAYKLSEKNLLEFRDKAREVLGPKEEKKVNDALAQARTDANPPDENAIVYTGNGETLCREELTGRYFRSSRQAIDSAINRLNYVAMSNMWTSVNDLFDEIELDEVALGNDMGWGPEKGMIEPVYSSALTKNGTPILVVDFRILPSPRPKYAI